MRKKYQKKAVSQKCTQAIIFARVSSKRQKDEGISLEVQEENTTQYCKEKGLKVIARYSIDESSTHGDRAVFHDMINFAAKCDGKVAIVVAYVDRLQRLPEDSYYVESLRRSGKVEIHFIKERLIITKDSAATELTFWNMFVMFANAQVNSQTDKVKASLAKNWSMGKWQGYAPIGYLNIRTEDNKADLIVDPVRGPIIKRLFEEFATGNHSIDSLHELSKTLGLYSIMKKKKGHYISRNSIYEMLTRPFYYGEMFIKEELLPHIYPPLISKALFDKVAKILETNGNHHCSCNIENEETNKTAYIFKKFIYCKECGCLITPEKKIKKSGRTYIYLRCGHHGKVCHQGIVNENIILEQIKREVLSKISLPQPIQALLKKHLFKELSDTCSFNQRIGNKIIQELQDIKEKEDTLLDYYLENKVTQEVYNRKKEALDKRIGELEKQKEQYKNISADLKENIDKVFSVAGNILNIFEQSDATKKNELLQMLFCDCQLNGTKLEYKLKAPFDKLIKCETYKDWPQVAIDNLEEFKEATV